MPPRTPRDQTTLGLNTDSTERQARRGGAAEQASVVRFVAAAARLLSDRHCTEVLALDVRGLSSVTDFVLLATGTSDRQMASVGTEIEELSRDYDLELLGRQSDKPLRWLVLDFIDVVVHVFDSEKRAFYDLETLWGDAPKVNWRR